MNTTQDELSTTPNASRACCLFLLHSIDALTADMVSASEIGRQALAVIVVMDMFDVSDTSVGTAEQAMSMPAVSNPAEFSSLHCILLHCKHSQRRAPYIPYTTVRMNWDILILLFVHRVTSQIISRGDAIPCVLTLAPSAVTSVWELARLMKYDIFVHGTFEGVGFLPTVRTLSHITYLVPADLVDPFTVEDSRCVIQYPRAISVGIVFPIMHLPPEIVGKIVDELPLSTFTNTAKVSKFFLQLYKGKFFFKC